MFLHFMIVDKTNTTSRIRSQLKMAIVKYSASSFLDISFDDKINLFQCLKCNRSTFLKLITIIEIQFVFKCSVICPPTVFASINTFGNSLWKERHFPSTNAPLPLNDKKNLKLLMRFVWIGAQLKLNPWSLEATSQWVYNLCFNGIITHPQFRTDVCICNKAMNNSKVVVLMSSACNLKPIRPT